MGHRGTATGRPTSAGAETMTTAAEYIEFVAAYKAAATAADVYANFVAAYEKADRSGCHEDWAVADIWWERYRECLRDERAG